ncbi:histidine phosphatase family protein [Cochlodiniinecator piscidefendens]|uniref:histidine phosphatase family protein n=1 Tax=Cochlodiniinecator piscidefendens TaxID=2715756 RepID=UPI0014089142|nr:histidine phosphatase family protein [Cochlodiniinecator piscidefendens]
MTEITLVRHGQANSGAKDEKSYDRLSDLGHQQANWLGTYLAAEHQYDHVVCGTLLRQRQTADGIPFASEKTRKSDDRLNEMSYFSLGEALDQQKGITFPNSVTEFQQHVPKVLDHWINGEIDGPYETYGAFETRIISALLDAAQSGSRVLCVTSTGVITAVVRHILNLSPAQAAKVFLATSHTSLHRITISGEDLHLGQFGSTPHLDTPERAHARTFV